MSTAMKGVLCLFLTDFGDVTVWCALRLVEVGVEGAGTDGRCTGGTSLPNPSGDFRPEQGGVDHEGVVRCSVVEGATATPTALDVAGAASAAPKCPCVLATCGCCGCCYCECAHCEKHGLDNAPSGPWGGPDILLLCCCCCTRQRFQSGSGASTRCLCRRLPPEKGRCSPPSASCTAPGRGASPCCSRSRQARGD